MTSILIVDDSPTMRKMVRASLRPLRATCCEAGSGLEAIELLALQTFDAVVLDLNMPDLHGLEVVRFIRQQRRYQELPILILTTRTDDASRKDTLQAGADRYITKPFRPGELLGAMRELLADLE